MLKVKYITVMSNYPIQRLLVYPAYPGSTMITWDLHPNMKDPLPYVYQLQRCRTANPDDEWENIGSPETNAIAMVDPNSVRSGFLLDCFYRIILTTGNGNKYVSAPEGCFGQLHRDEWKLATEILNKESLLFKKTAVPGVLLQVLRQGERCPYCSAGEYDDGIVNAHCEHCWGTGYIGGYHKPFQFQAWQVSPSQLKEIHYSNNVASMNMSVDRYQARATGIPEIYNGDIWVDLSTAQRFKISASKVIAQIRRVPLVREIDMELIPASEMVYKIPIGNDNYSSYKVLESKGCGIKAIDHNYPEEDALRYVDKQGRPVSGATVLIADENHELVFTTSTDTNGRWDASYKADPGIYEITFEKEGVYGPDYVRISVEQEEFTEEEQTEYEDRQEKQSVDYLTPFNI